MKINDLNSFKTYVAILSDEEQQLLKDIIKYGAYGDGEDCYIYIVNDAHLAGNFKGKKISALAKNIYHKLCTKDSDYTDGEVLSHDSDHWDDGTAVISIKDEYNFFAQEWADEETPAVEVEAETPAVEVEAETPATSVVNFYMV